jgi:hypothetical protein
MACDLAEEQDGHMCTDGKMPYEALCSEVPDLSAVCTWGCKVLVHNHLHSKLEPHAHKGHWLGWDIKA